MTTGLRFSLLYDGDEKLSSYTWGKKAMLQQCMMMYLMRLGCCITKEELSISIHLTLGQNYYLLSMFQIFN